MHVIKSDYITKTHRKVAGWRVITRDRETALGTGANGVWGSGCFALGLASDLPDGATFVCGLNLRS